MEDELKKGFRVLIILMVIWTTLLVPVVITGYLRAENNKINSQDLGGHCSECCKKSSSEQKGGE